MIRGYDLIASLSWPGILIGLFIGAMLFLAFRLLR